MLWILSCGGEYVGEQMSRVMGRRDCLTGEVLHDVMMMGYEAFVSGADCYAVEDESFVEVVNRLEIGVGRLKPREMFRLTRSYETGWRLAAWDAIRIPLTT